MAQTELRTAHVLSASIVILATVVSAGGLFLGDLYRNNALVTAGWFGNDLVTLVVAAPVLIAALILSLRGSLRAQLVWLGMLGVHALQLRLLPLRGSLQPVLPALRRAVYTLDLRAHPRAGATRCQQGEFR